MSSLSDKLQILKTEYEVKHKKKLTGEILGRELNISQVHANDIFAGRKKPSLELLASIAKFFDTSTDFLLGNTESTAHTSLASPLAEAAPAVHGEKVDLGMSFKNIVPPRNMMMIPVISPEIKPSAGYGNDYGYSDLEWTVIDTIPLADGEIAALYSTDNLLSMYVDGDSMEPQIHDGDLVVFNMTQEWVSGNIMVVCLDGRLLVKGLIYDGEGKPPILRSTNKEYPDIHVGENSFFIVYGRVLRIVRMAKPKPVL